MWAIGLRATVTSHLVGHQWNIVPSSSLPSCLSCSATTNTAFTEQHLFLMSQISRTVVTFCSSHLYCSNVMFESFLLHSNVDLQMLHYLMQVCGCSTRLTVFSECVFSAFSDSSCKVFVQFRLLWHQMLYVCLL